MPIKTFPLGPLETNCHLVHNGRTAVVVDPGGAPRPVLNYLEMQGLTLTHILNTHLHFDHIYGNAALAAATGAPILASAGDAFLRQTELGKGGAFGFPAVDDFTSIDLEPGEHRFGDLACTAFATPRAHTGQPLVLFPRRGHHHRRRPHLLPFHRQNGLSRWRPRKTAGLRPRPHLHPAGQDAHPARARPRHIGGRRNTQQPVFRRLRRIAKPGGQHGRQDHRPA